MGAFKDVTGFKFGNWLVLEQKGFNKHGASIWLVECQCDKKTKRIKDLSQIRAKESCGCKNIKNLKGNKYGRLNIISDPIRENGKIYYICECSCGTKDVKIRSDRLKDKNVSCGCYKKEVLTKTGCSRERLYGVWGGIINRCEDKKNKRYKNYGGRGIKLCTEWRENYLNFKEWALNNGYSDELTIERIDVNGDYKPSNCKWITWREQAQNKQNTIYFNIDGENIKLIDLAFQSGVPRQTILNRYKSGVRDVNKLLSKNNLRISNSGIIGVSYSNSQNNWRAYISINGKRKELGRKKNKDEAIKLRLNYELEYFGLENAPQKHLFKKYGIGDGLNEQ